MDGLVCSLSLFPYRFHVCSFLYLNQSCFMAKANLEGGERMCPQGSLKEVESFFHKTFPPVKICLDIQRERYERIFWAEFLQCAFLLHLFCLNPEAIGQGELLCMDLLDLTCQPSLKVLEKCHHRDPGDRLRLHGLCRTQGFRAPLPEPLQSRPGLVHNIFSHTSASVGNIYNIFPTAQRSSQSISGQSIL